MVHEVWGPGVLFYDRCFLVMRQTKTPGKSAANRDFSTVVLYPGFFSSTAGSPKNPMGFWKFGLSFSTTWMSRWKLGSKVRISGL